MNSDRSETSQRSLFALIGSVPALLSGLIRDELTSLRNEIIGKLKNAGAGIGLLVSAAFFALFSLMALSAAAVLGLATVLPAWVAALVVAAGIMIIAVTLALLGLRTLRTGMPPVPTGAIESIKKDVKTLKGTEKKATV